MKKFYVTTAIPYVNSKPHIGFALELVQADVIARFQRLLGNDVFFLSGTDDNALKNVQAAQKEKIEVKDFVKRNSDEFFRLKDVLNISLDDFIRTTEERHIKGAQTFWETCSKQDIYKKSYKGLYCIGCEAFYTEKDLVDGKCSEHKIKPEVVEEENYFFKLSNYQDWLENLIEKDELKIIPETKKNEMLSFIKQGLVDFSISRPAKRSHGWGISVPDDPEQIIYVWFDALTNYITALDWHGKGNLYKKYWPADVHVVGKGINRFHSIYWPAMLKSAGLPLPKQIFVHGYVNIEGEKISKSLGNLIDPFEVVDKFGLDPVRYYLLKEIPAYGDGDFSKNRFKEVYNSDLANGLGNLVARVAKLCEKTNFESKKEKIILCKKYKKYLKAYQFDKALSRIWEFISQADKYINENKIWEQDEKALKESLKYLTSQILKISYHLSVFMPKTAQK
ncbi:MAG: methionine--tRNA ligase, partial [Patescibacteria group bacterium]